MSGSCDQQKFRKIGCYGFVSAFYYDERGNGLPDEDQPKFPTPFAALGPVCGRQTARVAVEIANVCFVRREFLFLPLGALCEGQELLFDLFQRIGVYLPVEVEEAMRGFEPRGAEGPKSFQIDKGAAAALERLIASGDIGRLFE